MVGDSVKYGLALSFVVLIVILLSSVSLASADSLVCQIKDPTGDAVASDTKIFDFSGTHDVSCSASCPPTNSSCVQEEGQYTWEVVSDEVVANSGNAYYVDWDANQTWCEGYLGSGHWNIGGEVAQTTCCGDDSGENVQTCQDGGEGLCSQSSDNLACCDSGNDCVYNDACYSDASSFGEWKCQAGTWGDIVNPVASILINTGYSYTTSRQVNLTLTYGDNGSGIDLCNYRNDNESWGSWEACAGSKSWTLRDEDGTRTVYYRVRDRAGNTNEMSDTIFLDRVAPTTTMGGLPEYSNTKSLNITWSGVVGVSGIKCYDVQYRVGGGGWNTWRYYTTSTQAFFGPTEPVNVTDNTTYYFRARLTNNAGVVGEWSSVVSTTVDTVAPGALVLTTDQGGRALENVTSGLGISSVIITLNFTDSISGIANSTLRYWLTQKNKLESKEESCGSAAAGVVLTCSTTLPYDEDTIIKYQGAATDRAGNLNITGFMWVYSHPLANFVAHNLSLVLGDVVFMKVQVRNMQPGFDNITLSLFGYDFAGFLPMEGASVSGDGRNLSIGLNSYEDDEVFVKVYSSYTGNHVIGLKVTSGRDPSIVDSDVSSIYIGYSPSFSGLDALWVIVLITASLVIYAFRIRIF